MNSFAVNSATGCAASAASPAPAGVTPSSRPVSVLPQPARLSSRARARSKDSFFILCASLP